MSSVVHTEMAIFGAIKVYILVPFFPILVFLLPLLFVSLRAGL